MSDCSVTAFAGSGQGKSVDGIGSDAHLNKPGAMCLSTRGDSFHFIDSECCVRRVYLARGRILVGEQIAAGVVRLSAPLSAIGPLIDLISAYAFPGESKSFHRFIALCCTRCSPGAGPVHVSCPVVFFYDWW